MTTAAPRANPPARIDPLGESAQYVRGVGPARFELLQRLGITTVRDLLFYAPRDYEDLTDFRPIAQLQPEKLQSVVGEVVEIDTRSTRRGLAVVSVLVQDGTGVLEAVWYQQPFMAQKFRPGQRLVLSGKPRRSRQGYWQMAHPRVQPVDAQENFPANETPILPIYSLTEGLRQEQLRRIIRNALEQYGDLVPESLPEALRQARNLPTLRQTLHWLHHPKTLEEARQARRRLAYEEFLILHLALAHRRRDVNAQVRAPQMQLTRLIDQRIRRLFPFTLTRDQERAIAEICRDMAQDRPMRRLLQADVGAGKTAVAVYALLVCVANKHQAALMAPTEVLARQHWQTLNNYLAHSRVRRVLLTGSLSEAQRSLALGEIRMGQVDLVVGTQALIQNDVEFHRLGLVIIDEQHRFGVLQRAQFRNLGGDGRTQPHYLVMTATPIPRTVALTLFGDLDVSVIRQMPPGRQPVKTKLVPESQRPELEKYLRAEVEKGRQLYVVCPLVEGAAEEELVGDLYDDWSEHTQSRGRNDLASETARYKGAEQHYEYLRDGPFRGLTVGLLHGRMDERRKESVMARFRRGEIHVLVCTTVIEVGVDVPNATLMVIEHAERFGLSQLHQLRGRVTRGPVAGECYLFADISNDLCRTRLRLFVQTTDGFELAEADARLRGIGQFFGTRQHGVSELRYASFVKDGDLLEQARQDALELARADPGLRQECHRELRRAVLERYGDKLDLAEIG
ncbi:MAG: ATP-dependent DNA helicase RecG [Gemmatales bacterium]|nr:ATP-dependent DNA helicase RecG [Gemmatales bacterium]MDW7994118.1 ATP-dependent DNA helicase RecG [Gemmatales bacterium]